MKRKHLKTLKAIFTHPVSANIQRQDIESLFTELGAEISEREGSRVAVVLFDEIRVFLVRIRFRILTKGAVASIHNWLRQHGILP